jgi:hypothetical protein
LVGRGGGAPHDDSIAVDSGHLDGFAGVDQFPVGHDVDAFAVDLGDARRPQRRRSPPAPAKPVAVAARRRGVSLGGRKAGRQDQSTPKRQVRQQAQQDQAGNQRGQQRKDNARRRQQHGRRRDPGADHAEGEAAEDGDDAQRADDAEARDEERFKQQKDQAARYQQQFLPAGQLHQPVTPEEQRQAGDADCPGHPEAGRANLDQEAEDADGDEQRADHRMGQDADQVLRPVGRGPNEFGAAQAKLLQRAFQGVGAEIDQSVPQRFLGRQREELALLDHLGDGDIRIDHRLGEQRRPLAALGGGAELLADVGNGLLLDRLRGGAGLPHLHWRGGADRSAARHDQLLGGQADQRAGRDGSLVDEGNCGQLGAEQRIADLHGGIHPPAEGVDLQDHGCRAGVPRFLQDPPDKGRQAEIDDPVDGSDINDRSPVLGARSSERRRARDNDRQQAPDQPHDAPRHLASSFT